MPNQNSTTKQPKDVLFGSVTPVLITESAKDFADLCRRLEQDLKPRGLVEAAIVKRIAHIMWDIERYDRVKSSTINLNMAAALQEVLEQVGLEPDVAEELSERWFTEAEAKTEVRELLHRIGLDEYAVEAEAVRRSLDEIVKIERILGSLESRLKNALSSISEYRGVVVKLSRISDSGIEGGGVARYRPSTAA